MPIAIRSIGQIHFEDLEPHRFEDMVRQLLWDFRQWKELETTGRSGSDDGFDARGWEILSGDATDDVRDEEDDETMPETKATRLWLIQCKREQTITPKKLLGYLEAIPESERQKLHGIILAAACDFSKKSRDAFRLKIQQMGLAEGYLWGKGEIEDMLFQPKNDRLLFAYTGISLQTRRRSIKTEIRSKIAMKRKAIRLLQPHSEILIRDPTDDRYPYLDKDKKKDRFDRGRWIIMQIEDFHHDGLRIAWRRHQAFVDDDGERWDFAETLNDARPNEFSDPWAEQTQEERHKEWDAVHQVYSVIPDANKARYEILRVIPYENILEIDEKGDDVYGSPHIYTVPHDQYNGPFLQYEYRKLSTVNGETRYADARNEKRIVKFPRLKD